MSYGFWVDLAGRVFSDGATWIHAMPVRTYDHPIYGRIELSPDRIRRFAASVTNGVREHQLDIDYDHKTDPSKGKRAAGWITDAKAGDDGLWLAVDFTPVAREHLANGEYRYFSPELKDEWEHPSTGEVHRDVVFGGALTNRPFLKGILPINLSELFDDGEDMSRKFREFSTEERIKLAKQGRAIPEKNDDGEIVGGSFPIPEGSTESLKDAIQAIGRAEDYSKTKKYIIKIAKEDNKTDLLPESWDASTAEGDNGSKSSEEDAVDLTKLREMLQLGEDTSDDEAIAQAVAKLNEPHQESKEKGTGQNDPGRNEPGQNEDLKKLSEQHPEIAQLVRDNEDNKKRLQEQGTALRMSEVNGQLKSLSDESGGKYDIPSDAEGKLRDVMLRAGSKKFADEIYDVAREIVKDGLIELGEIGHSRTPGSSGNSKSAAMRFDEATTEAMKNDTSLSYEDAVVKVSGQRPELYDEYNREVLEGAES